MSVSVQEMGDRHTSFGDALYIKVFTSNERELSWRELWEAFALRYPGRWAVQMFPPESELVDEANIYHLLVLNEEPVGVTLRRAE